ncbi:MAG: molybdenum cofactor synthesis domain protein, partial [Rhodospirillales bacterium]|nr:molybdenum cofactor synthesis domain protein [Rhodospirillales bacterium]
VALDSDVTKSPKLREFPRARLIWAAGRPRAELYRDQSSNLLTSLSWADGILDLPTGIDELKAGDSVIYRPFAALLA